MAYTQKFQALADAARSRVEEVTCEKVDALRAMGYRNAGFIAGGLKAGKGVSGTLPLSAD